jgi:hypothetical protein
MAAIGNIVINDGQGTPVAHTFSPSQVSSEVVSYHDRVLGVVLGYPELSLSQKLSANGTGSIKQSLRISVPVLETVTGSTGEGFAPKPTLAYKERAFVEVYHDPRSSLQERKNLNAYLKNALANAAWTTLVENYEMPF